MAFGIAVIIVLGLSADYLFRRMNLPGPAGFLIAGVIVSPYVFGLKQKVM
jgi:Kef-type K+ transport system membrane component KefB